MLKNYIKIAWRNLTRNKGLSLINICGLAVALAVFLIISLFIRHETGYDQFYSDADRLYRVLMVSGVDDDVSAVLPEPVGPKLLELYPEVNGMVQAMGPYINTLVSAGDVDLHVDGYSAGSDFFNLFDFPWIIGSPEQALMGPGSVVITESLARRLFNKTDVVGETVTMYRQQDLTVTGVLADLPSNTHFGFDYISYRERSGNNSWMMRTAHTFLKLSSPSDAITLEEKLTDYVEQYKSEGVGTPGLVLQPVTDIHLYPDGPNTGSSRLFYIGVLFIVSILILLVASINYINLATVRLTERSREVGVRKSSGANRSQIIFQLTMESIMIVMIAFLLSLLLVEMFIPVVYLYFDVRLMPLFTFSLSWIGVLILTLFSVGIVSGTVSALYLSSLNPAQVLTGRGVPSGRFSAGLRKGLVVTQFVISISIVLATLLIMEQLDFIRSERLSGVDEQVILIRNSTSREEGQFEILKQELLRHPDIAAVSAGTIPNLIRSQNVNQDSSGTTITHTFYVEHDYLETLDLTLLSGRNFDSESASGSRHPVILNETAARVIDIGEATGQEIRSQLLGTRDVELLGIVQDFHALTLFDPIHPVVMRLGDPDQAENFLVRFREGGIESGLGYVQEVWSGLNPEWPLVYHFLDERLDQDYRTEIRMARIFGAFSGFSILIACLGLFGLAAYTAQARTKEIGIRKVMGATVVHILALLNKDFLKLVILGFLIANPIAWYAMNRWLQDFAYRIEIGPGVFLLAGGAALLIATVTISWQSLKTALMNPVESLRNE